MKCRCQGEFCQYLMIIRSTPDRESAPTIPIVAIDVTSLPVKIHPATERAASENTSGNRDAIARYGMLYSSACTEKYAGECPGEAFFFFCSIILAFSLWKTMAAHYKNHILSAVPKAQWQQPNTPSKEIRKSRPRKFVTRTKKVIDPRKSHTHQNHTSSARQ